MSRTISPIRTVRNLSVTFFAILLAASAAFAQDAKAAKAAPSIRSASLPLMFEQNVGQPGASGDFTARGDGYTLHLKSGQMSLRVLGPNRKVDDLGISFAGANQKAAGSALDKLPTLTNYMIGRDRSKWRTGVVNYGKVQYAGIYNGVDVLFYGHQGQIEHDFVVAPNANAKSIALQVSGAKSLKLNANGDVVMNTANGGQFLLKRPDVYQQVGANRVAISGGYRLLSKNRVAFKLGNYDKSRELTIDPVLVYATYVKGTLDTTAVAVAVDTSNGDAYYTGTVLSDIDNGSALTTHEKNAVPLTAPNTNFYIAKLAGAANGSTFAWVSYIGGEITDTVKAINFNPTPTLGAAGAAGIVAVSGETNSTMFPTTGNAGTPFSTTLGELNAGFAVAVDSTHGGDTVSGGGFYGTYIRPGTPDPTASTSMNGIQVNNSGFLFMAGSTQDSNFGPATDCSAFNGVSGTSSNGFVIEIDPNSATPLKNSAFVNGATAEAGGAVYATTLNGIVLSNFTSDVYVTGSANYFFPSDAAAPGTFVDTQVDTTNTLTGAVLGDLVLQNHGGVCPGTAALVHARIYHDATNHSTDHGRAINSTTATHLWFGGDTNVGTLTTGVTINRHYGGATPGTTTNGFVVEVNLPLTTAAVAPNVNNPEAAGIVFSGGSNNEQVNSIDVDQFDNAYLGGQTATLQGAAAPFFPSVNPLPGLDTAIRAVVGKTQAGFLEELDSTMTAQFVTVIGGTTTASDAINGVAAFPAQDGAHTADRLFAAGTFGSDNSSTSTSPNTTASAFNNTGTSGKNSAYFARLGFSSVASGATILASSLNSTPATGNPAVVSQTTGMSLTYSFDITSPNNASIFNFPIVAGLDPAGFTAPTAPAGVLCTFGAGGVTCQVPSTTSGTIVINAKTLSGLTAGSNFVVTATLADANNDVVTASETTFVAPQMVTATITVANRAYDGTTNATLATCTVSPVYLPDTTACAQSATVTDTQFASANASAIPITVTANNLTLTNNASGNYTLSSTTATTTATINKAHLTVTADPQTMSYTGAVFSPFTATLSGFVNSETDAGLRGTGALSGAASFSGAATTAVNAGVYNTIIPAQGTLTATNYDFTVFNNGTLTINKVHLTVTADPQTKTYNGLVFSPFTATLSGFVNSETDAGLRGTGALSGAATFSGAATTAVNAGVYNTIIPAQGTLTATNYDFTVFNNGTLTINKAHLTVTADPQTMSYTGAVFSPFTATLSGFVNSETDAGLRGTGALSGAATFSGAATTAVNAGTYTNGIVPAQGTLTATNYDFTVFNNGTLTINKVHLTVTADPQTKTYNGLVFSPFTATLTGFVNSETDAGLRGTGALSGAATFSGAATTAVNAGTYTNGIVPAQGTLAATNYDFTVFNNGTLTINKAHLTVTADPQTKTYNGLVFSPFTATLSGFVNGETDAGLRGTGALSGAATFSGAATTAVNAGVYNTIIPAQGTLTATNYDFTVFNNGTLTINKAHLTVTADPQTKTYDGMVFSPFTATLSGFVNSETDAGLRGTGALSGAASFSGAATTAVNAGTYTNGIVPAQGTLTATNYDFTVFNNGTLTINKVHLTVTADPQTKTYNGLVFSPFTATLSGFVNGETDAGLRGTGALSGAATFSGAATTAVNAGVYNTIIPAQGTLAATNYDFTVFNNGTLTINKAHLTVTADPQTMSYTGAVFSPFTATLSGFVNSETDAGLRGTGALSGAATFSGAATTAVNAGVYNTIIPAQGTLAATNYDFTVFNNGTLTINKVHLTVTADPQTKTYNAAVFSPFTATLSGFVNSETDAGLRGTGALSGGASFSGAATTAVNAGTYTNGIVPAQGTLAATNYDFTVFNNGTLVINKAGLTIAAVANTKIYDATNAAATLPSVTGLQGSDTVTGSAETYDTKNVGTGKTMSVSAFTVNDGNGGNNYTVSTPTSATGTITQKSLTESGLSAAPSKVYDATTNASVSGIPSFQVENVGTGTNVDGKAYLGDAVNLSGAATGTYNSPNVAAANTVTFGGLSLRGVDAPNYALVLQGSAAATITAAPLHINAVLNTKVYGAADPALSFSATGFQGADTQASVLSGAIARVAGENVGSYAINQGTLASNTNYSITYTGANFTITPATLTVTAVAKTKVYGAADPGLTFNATGFQFADTQASVVTGSLARVAGETVAGSPYAINQGSVAADTNYTISYTGATFTITAATLNVSAVANTKVYGSADPALTFTASGFQFTDTVGSVITGNVARAAGETVGPYAIGQGTLVANGNYALAYTAANFTVTPAPLTVTPANQSRPYGGQNPVLTGTVSGLQFTDQITGQYTTTATAAANVGNYPITVMGLNDPNGRVGNYTVTNNTGQFTIAPANTQVGSVTISQVANSSGTPQFTMSASISNSSVQNAAGSSPGGNLIFKDCVGAACTQIAKVALAGGSATTGTITLTSNSSAHAIMVSYDQGDANYAAPATTSGNGTGIAVLSTISTSAGAAIPAQTVPILNPTGSSGPVSYTQITCAITSGGFPVANTICTPSPTAINNLAVGTTFNVQVSLATKGASAQPAATQARLHLRGLESLSLVLPAILVLPLGMSADTRRKLLRRRTLTWLAIGMLLALMLMASSCGGGGFNNPNSLQPNSGGSSATPVGNYIVQVTGTNQNGQSVVMANIPLTVGF